MGSVRAAVVEIAAGPSGSGVVAGGQPDLGLDAQVEVVGGVGPPMRVGTQPGSTALEGTWGQRLARAKASVTSSSLDSA